MSSKIESKLPFKIHSNVLQSLNVFSLFHAGFVCQYRHVFNHIGISFFFVCLYEVDTSLAGLTHSIEYIFLTDITLYI